MTPKILLLLLLTGLVTACCNEEYEFRGDVSVSLAPRTAEITPAVIVDTLREPFYYYAELSYDLIGALPAVRWSQALMAFSCEGVYDRTPVDSTVTVSLDRSFTFNGRIVPPNVDLLPLLTGVEAADTYANVGWLGVNLEFGKSFLDLASFPAATYSFQFRASLDDGTPVSVSTPVYLDFP